MIQRESMGTRLNNIKILIWDFDGTLYKSNEALWHDIREAEYQTIIRHTGWSRDKAIAAFKKTYKNITPSATEAVAFVCKIKTVEAAKEMDGLYDRRKYIFYDPKLVILFKKLSHFRHFILANGIIDRIKETIGIMGVPQETFEEVVTSEIVGVTKPHEKGFRYILDKTKLPVGSHLMIGDREAVDIAPAKAVGMKTCLVWSKEKSFVADITLPTVYDIEKILV